MASAAPPTEYGVSILRNPLPPPAPSRRKSSTKPRTVLVSHAPSPPAAHYQTLYSTSDPVKPSLVRTTSALSSVSHASATTTTDSFKSTATSTAGAPSISGSVTGGVGGTGTIVFAPLPPGRSRFRSNSLTIGVAARARMIASQGGGSQRAQPRYAGPQQWYQPGAVVPDDVYTYKDAAAALNKVWGKLSKRSGSSSSASAATAKALAIEKEGKGDEGEDERIEDIHEHDEEDESAIDDEEEDDDSSIRGRPTSLGEGALHMRGMGVADGESTDSRETDEIHTPEDSITDISSLARGERKHGKGVERGALGQQAML